MRGKQTMNWDEGGNAAALLFSDRLTFLMMVLGAAVSVMARRCWSWTTGHATGRPAPRPAFCLPLAGDAGPADLRMN